MFVCTGNICRSPTAERLSAAYCAQRDLQGLTFSSAGTHAVIASPIHPESIRVLENLGADASNFAARQLTPRIAAGADLILTMTTAHRAAVLELAPRQLQRTFTLVEAANLAANFGARTFEDLPTLRPQLAKGAALDVADPIGQDREFFSAVGSMIADLLPPVLELERRA